MKKIQDICSVQLKKGMRLRLLEANEDTGAKKGDIVRVTSVTCMGCKSEGYYTDYEVLRVANDKFSWRISRESAELV